MAQEPSSSNQPPNNDDSTLAGAPSQVVYIKQEKIDPEIENKIKLIKQEVKPQPNDNGENTGVTNGDGDENRETNESDDDDEDSNDSQSSSQEQNGEDDAAEEDEKKNIEPVKSSNEILTELFQVFNAAPPVELLDDKNLIKKTKKHKKEKKKKHKKQKEPLGEDAEDGELLAGEKSKHKKKKKHKHKNKDGSKDRDKGKSRDKEKSKENKKSKVRDKSKDRGKSQERAKSKDRAKSKEREKKSKEKDTIKKESLDKYDKPLKSLERKRHHDKDQDLDDFNKRRKKNDRDTRHRENHFYNGFDKDKEGNRTRERPRGNDKSRVSKECDVKIKKELVDRRTQRLSDEGNVSEISLSDEETYLKEKEIRPVDHSKRKAHNSFYDGVKRSLSRDRDRDRNRDRNHNKDNFRDRDRDNSYGSRGFSRRHHSRYSRSRSRSRSHDLGIDKKRLLEIARKNAISMFKRGNLPGCDNMSQEIKDKVLIKMRYGGRTVEDLTEFCKKISIGENLSDLSSDEDSDVDKAGNTKAFHHPFQLKEREPIVMHIRNSKPILPALPKTDEQTKAITMQFPVSSGQQHRMTEHWVPVEAKDSLAPLPSLPAAAPSSSIFKNNMPKNALGKTLPMAGEQEPAFKPVPATDSEEISETAANIDEAIAEKTPPSAIAEIPKTVPPPVIVPPPDEIAVEKNKNVLPSLFVPDVPVPSTNSSIFPRSAGNSLDVSSIISKRLNAMRRLQDNPMDSEALKMMYNSQKEMTSWASSKHLPGQFIGSTGVNVLKPNELHSGPQVWARRDQLTSSKPVTGGMGMHLLQKMGWKPGEGLGREKNGSLQPLLLDVKLDKRGLVAQEDAGGRKQPPGKKNRAAPINQQQAQQNLEEKHPVCLLNELTSKRKWTPPLYTLVNEKGPSHSKMFLFAVQVNGQSFTPDRASNTKKEAKMIAAKHCLQQIGILPGC